MPVDAPPAPPVTPPAIPAAAPTPAAPTPAAPAAAPAPAAPPEPPKPPEPKTGKEDPILKSLWKDLDLLIDEPPPAKPGETPPAPAPAPGTPAAAAPAVPAATPPPEPQKKVTVKKAKPVSELVEESVRKVMAEKPEPPPVAPAPVPAPVAPSPTEEYEKSLGAMEKATLEVARFAESKFPERKGLAEQFVSFYKAVDAYVAKARTDDPERTLDESDEAFQTFIAEHRPDIDPVEWRQLESAKLKDEAKNEASKEVEAKLRGEIDETKRNQHALEVKPVIEKRLAEFESNIGKMLLEEKDSPVAEVVKSIEEHGLQKTLETDKVFAPIVFQAYAQGATAAAEYMSIYNGIKPFNQENKTHQWLVGFIRRQGEYFAENGGDKRIRTAEDGSKLTFMPNGKYGELLKSKPEEAAKHWTFDDKDVVGMIEANTRTHAVVQVKRKQDELTASGFERKKPQIAGNGKPAAPETPPEPGTSPIAGQSAAPGAASGGGAAPKYAMAEDELKALGLPTVR